MPLYLETLKNLEFDNLGIKNLGFEKLKKIWKNLEFLTCSVVKFRSDTNNLSNK